MMETAWNTPFDEQLKFFRQKGYKISPDSWRDVWKQGHARAFTVARVTAMDVLEDIRKAVDNAKTSGTTLREFKKVLTPLLVKKGWFAPEDEDAIITLPDGTIRKRLAGWRLDNILRTNFAASYSVGRYKQQQAVKTARPYLQYRSQQDPSTRDAHRALDGVIKKQDDPFWDMHYPPNGFGCRCYTKTLSERQMKTRGLSETGATPKVPIDEGWDYNVGKSGLDAWKPDLKKYPPKARKVLKKALEEVPEPAGFVPAKTIKEAEAWAKNSKIKNTLYHSTDNARDIMQEGFSLDVPIKNGRINGDGIYFADKLEDAHWGNDVLKVKVNVKNPLSYDDINYGRGLPDSFRGNLKDMERFGDDGFESNWSWIEELGEKHFKDYERHERITKVLSEMGVDAVTDTRINAGINVFDPKNIMIIKD